MDKTKLHTLVSNTLNFWDITLKLTQLVKILPVVRKHPLGDLKKPEKAQVNPNLYFQRI